MSKITGYLIAMDLDPIKLSIQINGLLQQGWELHGAPFTRPISQTGHICQAMIHHGHQGKEFFESLKKRI